MRHEPILNFDFPLDETAAEGVWHQASRYSVWMGRQSKGAPPYQMVERHAEGFVRLPPRPRLMRVVPAGTPFRLAHLFAPFRISDADLIYIRAEMEAGSYHVLLAATGREVTEDAVAWFCPTCGIELAQKGFATGRHGLNAFWPFLLDEARAFNVVPDRQVCASCGAHHPVCYGFDAKLDRPDEAVARAEW